MLRRLELLNLGAKLGVIVTQPVDEPLPRRGQHALPLSGCVLALWVHVVHQARADLLQPLLAERGQRVEGLGPPGAGVPVRLPCTLDERASFEVGQPWPRLLRSGGCFCSGQLVRGSARGRLGTDADRVGDCLCHRTHVLAQRRASGCARISFLASQLRLGGALAGYGWLAQGREYWRRSSRCVRRRGVWVEGRHNMCHNMCVQLAARPGSWSQKL